MAIVSGTNQTGSPGGFVSSPLVVSVTDSSGNPLHNAPVVFSVASGGGQLQGSSSGTASSSLTVCTDGSGQATAFFQLPDINNAECQITCTGGTGNHVAQVTFTENSDDGSGSYASPFDPSNMVATGNIDGSVDIEWQNNTDSTSDIPIQLRQPDGSWTTVATVPAGTTYYHIPPQ